MQPTPCAVQKVRNDMHSSGSDPGKSGLDKSEESKARQRRDELPPELVATIWPALQLGGLFGMLTPCDRYPPKFLESLLNIVHIVF